MKVVFCGTPQFAVPTLKRLVAEDFEVALVVTNPDEPRGRGYELKPPPVKEAALTAGIEVFQPARLKDPEAQATITAAHPDAVVVVAYGHLIPPWMVGLPPLGCINLHASLLPRYRGAAPIPWAIMLGERVTGNTTMKIDAGLDTGDILMQQEIEIAADDTAETLAARLSVPGAGLMVETLRRLVDHQITARPQDHERATLAPMLKKEDGRIDWTMPSRQIACRVHGLRPWPVAYTTFRGKALQIWAAQPFASARPLQPGELGTEAGRLIAGCGGMTILELSEVQAPGRKRIQARDFAHGVRLQEGEMLGG